MKTSRFLLLSTLFVLAGLSVQAQDLVRHVDVTGQAEVRRAPDQVVVTLGVETWNTDLAAARQENGTKIARLLAVPARFGIAPADVKTDFASVEPQYDRGDNGQVLSITGYRVAQGLSILVRDLKVVDAVVTAAFGAGANRLDGVAFGLADASSAAAEARLLAVRSARAKAVALATELGGTVGKALIVSDQSQGFVPAQPRFKTMGMAADEMAGSGDAFAPGQIVVSAQVNVWFELKD